MPAQNDWATRLNLPSPSSSKVTGLPSRSHSEKCTWVPLPSPPTVLTGTNDARAPPARATARSSSFETTARSAAPIDGAGAIVSSNWSGANSANIISGSTPACSSARIAVLANGSALIARWYEKPGSRSLIRGSSSQNSCSNAARTCSPIPARSALIRRRNERAQRG
jgi:hypothetical protein